jgi:uncharacterized protein
MTDHASLMEFPCDFPIKIIGKNSAVFATDVVAIARKHFPNTPDASIDSKSSEKSNYIAITVTVRALNQATLDALYLELTQHPDIKMVL